MRIIYLSDCFNPTSEVSSSHAGRVFNEQNAMVEILRFVMRDQIYRSACNPQESAKRRTIGSRSRSVVCTNEVVPYSRILRSHSAIVVLTLARYFPRASTLDGQRTSIEFCSKTFIFLALVLTI